MAQMKAHSILMKNWTLICENIHLRRKIPKRAVCRIIGLESDYLQAYHLNDTFHSSWIFPLQVIKSVYLQWSHSNDMMGGSAIK